MKCVGIIAYSRPFFDVWPTSKAHFMPNGHAARGWTSSASRIWRTRCAPWWRPRKKRWPAGATREAAIDAVRDYFYRGEIARKIDAFIKANGGLLRYEDMAAFKLEPEEPVSSTYHGLSKSTSPASGARGRR